jgi:SAM-dependent methyltransferase
MTATPDFVDASLRDALRAAFPGVPPPGPGDGVRLCLGAGEVAPADWLCVDPSYPPSRHPSIVDAALRDGAGRLCGRAEDAHLALLPGSCSAVYAHHVAEHLPVERQAEALRSWVRLLRPGGVLYVCGPDLEAVCARTLESVAPGSAEPWFAAEPEHRCLPGELPGRRRGLSLGTGGMSAWYWLYCGGDHLSVPSEAHLRDALRGEDLDLRRVRRRLRDVPEEYRLFVSMELLMVGVRGAGPAGSGV